MGKVSQIRAASKTVEVGGETFEIKPLTNDELLGLSEPEDENDVEAVKEYLYDLLATVLQKDDPDNTRDAIAEAPSTLIGPVMEAVEEVNQLDFLDEEAVEDAKQSMGLNK